jgi:DNA-binding GntR family transcriptional regulator
MLTKFQLAEKVSKSWDGSDMLTADMGESATSKTIYDRIWAAIADRKLQPGTHLKEEKLSEIFNVSRARVRNALASLERDGLVTIILNKGAFVSEPSIEEARDIFFARKTIEGRLVERLCSIRDDSIISKLRAHVTEERAAVARNDKTAVIRLSGGFHILAGELSGSTYLSEVLRDLVSRTSLIIAMYQTHSHPDCGPDEHDGVVDMIAQGNAPEAASRMLHHLGHIEGRLDLEAPHNIETRLESILK